MLERDYVPAAAPTHPCAVCGVEAPWEVWGVRICPRDFAQLDSELEFTPKGLGCSEEAFCGTAASLTRVWVAKAHQLATRATAEAA